MDSETVTSDRNTIHPTSPSSLTVQLQAKRAVAHAPRNYSLSRGAAITTRTLGSADLEGLIVDSRPCAVAGSSRTER